MAIWRSRDQRSGDRVAQRVDLRLGRIPSARSSDHQIARSPDRQLIRVSFRHILKPSSHPKRSGIRRWPGSDPRHGSCRSRCVMPKLLLVFLLALAGCTGSTGPTDPAQPPWRCPGLAGSRSGITDYQFTIARVCECTPESTGPVVVEVRGGVVEERTYVSGSLGRPAVFRCVHLGAGTVRPDR